VNDFAADEWRRATASLRAARSLIHIDADSAASRAYYAAFHAVSALFALRGQSFLRAAVRRDWVKPRDWDKELRRSYDYLVDLRETGDYGGASHASQEDAEEAVRKANLVLEAVRRASPQAFPETDAPC